MQLLFIPSFLSAFCLAYLIEIANNEYSLLVKFRRVHKFNGKSEFYLKKLIKTRKFLNFFFKFIYFTSFHIRPKKKYI